MILGIGTTCSTQISCPFDSIFPAVRGGSVRWKAARIGAFDFAHSGSDHLPADGTINADRHPDRIVGMERLPAVDHAYIDRTDGPRFCWRSVFPVCRRRTIDGLRLPARWRYRPHLPIRKSGSNGGDENELLSGESLWTVPGSLPELFR